MTTVVQCKQLFAGPSDPVCGLCRKMDNIDKNSILLHPEPQKMGKKAADFIKEARKLFNANLDIKEAGIICRKCVKSLDSTAKKVRKCLRKF